MQYQAICFDFDYTLGDSTVPITIGYQRGLTAMGWPEPTVEQVRPTIGYTLQDGYTMLTGDGDQVRRDEFYHRFQAAVGELALQNGDATMVRETRLFPGARELLEALRAAGCAGGYRQHQAGGHHPGHFGAQRHGRPGEADRGRRTRQPTQARPPGAERGAGPVGRPSGKTPFCGDTTIDARTAQAAGTDFCAVLNGTTREADFAPYPKVHSAPNLTELRGWLGL